MKAKDSSTVKMILIKSCTSCPHHSWRYSRLKPDEYEWMCLEADINGIPLGDMDGRIPEWCPLPNYIQQKVYIQRQHGKEKIIRVE